MALSLLHEFLRRIGIRACQYGETRLACREVAIGYGRLLGVEMQRIFSDGGFFRIIAEQRPVTRVYRQVLLPQVVRQVDAVGDA